MFKKWLGKMGLGDSRAAKKCTVPSEGFRPRHTTDREQDGVKEAERKKEKLISSLELFQRRDKFKKEALFRKLLKLQLEVVPRAQV